MQLQRLAHALLFPRLDHPRIVQADGCFPTDGECDILLVPGHVQSRIFCVGKGLRCVALGTYRGFEVASARQGQLRNQDVAARFGRSCVRIHHEDCAVVDHKWFARAPLVKSDVLRPKPRVLVAICNVDCQPGIKRGVGVKFDELFRNAANMSTEWSPCLKGRGEAHEVSLLAVDRVNVAQSGAELQGQMIRRVPFDRAGHLLYYWLKPLGACELGRVERYLGLGKRNSRCCCE